jgi:hypothetical protein
MLIRADIAKAVTFPVDMRLSQDLYYILNIYRTASGAYIEDPLVEVRRHAQNSYRRGNDKILPDIEAMTRTLSVTQDGDHRTALRRRLGQAWLAAGYHFFWCGDPHASVSAYFRALRYPGNRRRALTRLPVAPFAPLISRCFEREREAFPGGKR